eukprot:UN14623
MGKVSRRRNDKLSSCHLVTFTSKLQYLLFLKSAFLTFCIHLMIILTVRCRYISAFPPDSSASSSS